MKILFLTRKFWPSIGGVEKHVGEISQKLIARGHEVSVVSEGDGKEEINKVKIFRIPITVGEKLKKFQIWYWLWKNRGLIKESDLIHCHDVFFWYLPFCLLYPKKSVFTTFHGWEGKYPIPLKTRIIRKMAEKLSRGTICVGDFIKKWYGTKANGVTYGGTNLVQKLNSNKQKDYSKLKIVYLGRLEEDTGLLIYLACLRILKNNFHNLQVVFLGDGNLREKAEEHGEVKGFVQDIEQEIADCRFVFTSGYLSILQALIQRKPVFSVYANPVKEDYLKMAPFANCISIENDPVELASKVGYYINNFNEVKEMIDRAYAWAIKQTWERVVDDYLKLWRV